MFQKIGPIFMVFWVSGIAYMIFTGESWPLRIMIPAFIVFWAWGFIYSIFAVKKKKAQMNQHNERFSGSESMHQPTQPIQSMPRSAEPEVKAPNHSASRKSSGSWLESLSELFSSKDDRFKR